MIRVYKKNACNKSALKRARCYNGRVDLKPKI